MTLNHAFVSGKADGGDATLARASNWNAGHVVGAYGVGTAPIMVAANDATDREKAMALLSGGAVCDGTADNVQIQAAIDACTGTSWQTVRLLGTFSTTAAIVMESYVRLELEGKVKTADAANVHILTATSKNHFEIVGGDWDGNKTNAAAGDATNGMEIDSCSYFWIGHATVHDPHVSSGGSNGYGILVIDSTYGIIEDCDIYECGHAASAGPPAIEFLNACADCKVIHNKVHDSDGGIYFLVDGGGVYSLRHLVQGNTIYTIQRDGISLYNGDVGGVGSNKTDYFLIDTNHLTDCGLDGEHPAIVVGNKGPANWNVISSNYITNPTNSGASDYLGGSGINLWGNHNSFIGNNIHDVEGHGFVIEASAHNEFIGNTVDGTRHTTAVPAELRWPVLLQLACTENVFVGNHFINGQHYGIYITDNSLNNRFTNNFVLDMLAEYIRIDAGSNYNVFEQNTVTTNDNIDSGTGTIWSRNVPLDTHTLF